ncbi:MAG: VOC family protein [Chlamydiales bacterium]
MVKLEKVIETVLYCENLELLISFYTEVLQLKPMRRDDRFCAFDVNGESVFLLFRQRGSLHAQNTAGGIIPSHDGSGPTHMAFAISKEELSDWEQRLMDYEVNIISRVDWPLGGTSIYFHDPEEHLIELATPGVWSIY